MTLILGRVLFLLLLFSAHVGYVVAIVFWILDFVLL